MKRFFVLIVLLLLILPLYFISWKTLPQKPVIKKVTPPSGDLYLPENLEATLWAESPMFYNPTNMDVDSKGRIWITEAVDYRNYNNDSAKFLHHPQGDRVMILEDKDKDGKADTAIVFVQDKDLISPLGIAVIGNKVIVSCSPNMVIYTDENGDDKPDKKEIFLTGFGGKDHDHSLHAVFSGPDGNWYFNVGNAGPHIVKDKLGWTLRSGSIYTGGSPYNTKNEGNLKSDDGRVWVGGMTLQIKPDGTGLKVMGHNFRNSYEAVPDSYGNLWQNDNDDQVVTCRTTWLMEGGNAGFFSSDGTRYWQADQRPGQDIFTAHWHQEDPGVMPAGDRSGAGAPTGIAINESDVLGEEYRGLLLSADAGRNVIFGYLPTLTASGYNLGERKNFITSLSKDNPGYVWNDTSQNNSKEKWFRPSDVTIGTDGAIYVADWHDPVVGGHQMQDPKGYGRIYRITPKNKKLTAPVISLDNLQGQLQAFKSPAINVRNTGFQKLVQQGEAVVETVKSLLTDTNPYVQARAIWLMAQLGENGKAEVITLLRNDSELVRATAYRALRQVVADILPYAETMQGDPSAFVRREVAVSLKGLPFEKIKPVLREIIKRYDGFDRWYLETIGDVVTGHEPEIYGEALKIFGQNKPAVGWNKQMASLAWRLHPESAISDLVKRAGESTLPAKERQEALTALAFIHTNAAASSMMSLAKSKTAHISEMAAYWLSFRQSNDWYSLLDWSKLNLNTRYERKLAQMKVKKQIVLDERQSLNERKWRVQEMAADSIGGQLLIGIAADDKLPGQILPFIEATIFKNPDATVRVQASQYFNRPGTNKTFSIQHISALQANRKNGKALFSNRCASCHRFGNEGKAIGPDLTTIGKKFDELALLDAIINPSAAIVFGYEPWLVNTKDGGSLYGFIVSQNKEAIVLKDLAGQKHLVPIQKVSSKEKQRNSPMPDPVANGLTEQNVADITAYLLAKS